MYEKNNGNHFACIKHTFMHNRIVNMQKYKLYKSSL